MDWLTAAEALALLGTRPQTLYANVSRGRIQAKRDPEDTRKSLYWGEDVRKLAQRRAGKRRTEIIATETIRWGDPILPSSISTIVGGRLYYRGQDAVRLAQTALFEEVVALLWESEGLVVQSGSPLAKGRPLERMIHALADRSVHDAPSISRTLAILRREAGAVYAATAQALVGPGQGALHERLANSWQRPEAAEPIRCALILLSDHELNASAFAARIAASTGASLASAALAGLVTLNGPLHGGASIEGAAFAKSAEEVGAEQTVRSWLAQGRNLPGFGHALYPQGDIRAKTLLETFCLPQSIVDLQVTAEEISGEMANIDFALVGLARAFDLPEDAPLLLFALARLAGWLAHAMEQAETGHLIRPRARYTGPPVQID